MSHRPNQKWNCSSWPWNAHQTSELILTERAKESAWKSSTGEWRFENSLRLIPLIYFCDRALRDVDDSIGGWERSGVELCWRSVYEGGCDHDWQRRDDGEGKRHEGPDTRAAMAMRVTSMRLQRQKTPTASVPHPLARYLCLAAPTHILISSLFGSITSFCPLRFFSINIIYMSYSAFVLCAAQRKGWYLSVTPVQVHRHSSPFPTQRCCKSHFFFCKENYFSHLWNSFKVEFFKTELSTRPTVKPNSLHAKRRVLLNNPTLWNHSGPANQKNMRNNSVNHQDDQPRHYNVSKSQIRSQRPIM